MGKKLVVLVYRKAFPHVFSIEFIFDQVKSSLQTSRRIDKYILPKFSNSFLNRTANILSLIQFQNKIVHVTGDVHYAILGAWFSLRILTIHDLAFMNQNKGIKRSILKWFWIIFPVKFSNVVTVISEATKVDLSDFVSVNPKKIKVIPNFVSSIYQPIPHHNFNNKHPNLLQIGTAFNKNIDRLAEALATISCTLTIVGKLDREQIQILKNFKVQYINKVDLTEEELYQEYTCADLLTFVSTIEGFGMPIIEANACGLPVLTADCSSMPEVASNAALLVDPFDVASIRNGILELIGNENLRNKLIKNGFENARRFSKATIVKKYELLYQELENQFN